VRQDRRRDARVVVDDLALAEAGLGVEDLVEVGELELASFDDDFDRVRGVTGNWVVPMAAGDPMGRRSGHLGRAKGWN